MQQYGDLSISNLTITNGSAGNGGGILVDSGGVLTLSSVVIKDSEATSSERAAACATTGHAYHVQQRGA